MDLKEFYKEAGELDAGEEKPVALRAPGAAQKQPGPVKRREQLEQQLIQVKEQSDKLTDLMEKSRVKEGDPASQSDSPSRLEALGELIKLFFKQARIVRVNMQEEDSAGLKQFAMKELSADKDTADRQMSKLEEHLKIAQQFFPNIELKEIASADDPPKRIAIVLGLEAEEFNAVVMAEKTRLLYEKQVADVEQGIKEATAAVEAERATRRAQAASKTPAVDAAATRKDTKQELTFH